MLRNVDTGRHLLFIHIVLYTIKMVSKQLYMDRQEKIIIQ